MARYADSNGSDENFTYYDAWRFRNYVIGAFNADKPFDRFLTEQLAGDLLPFRTQEERDDNLVATGFLVVGPKVIGATDKKQLLVDVIDEQLDTIGKAFLGLTIGCARCHDHKFDPISARDYYALGGHSGEHRDDSRQSAQPARSHGLEPASARIGRPGRLRRLSGAREDARRAW